MGDKPFLFHCGQYIAVKGNLNGPDKVFILGTEDNTSISINGTTSGRLMQVKRRTYLERTGCFLRDERARNRAAHDRIRLKSAVPFFRQYLHGSMKWPLCVRAMTSSA